MTIDAGFEIAKLSGQFLKEIWDILQERCDVNATEIDLFACLIAAQTVTEAITVRLQNMGVEEELIQTAIENAKNQIVFTLQEQSGSFYMKGEEV